ncbi:MAG: hypothetical protein K2J85_06760 [Anaeroplasmataceae bacterium]|nr:hypothetical protein [Anaeroplasmataceae bacterium]
MKKKSILFIFVIILCFMLFGCKEESPINNYTRFLDFHLHSSDGACVYPYGPTPTEGKYVLKEHQTYELTLEFNGAMFITPEGIIMEYDDTVFEIICLTTPESPEYMDTIYYNITCLKVCNSTSFAAYLVGHSDIDDYNYHYEFVFQVE